MLGTTETQVMTMSLNEAGHDKPPRKLNDLCLRTDIRSNVFIAANRCDLVTINGKRLNIAGGRIGRRNLATAKDQISRWLAAICRSRRID